MNVKKILLAWILVIAFGICGCGNKEKTDSNEEFSAEGISEILMVQQDDDTDKNLAEQFSFGEAGKIILYIPKDNAVSLAIDYSKAWKPPI
ncbi:MAG: hypothetical protein K1W34_06415 [Lachnospiraceae bacterium]